jgi:hypothetical protein
VTSALQQQIESPLFHVRRLGVEHLIATATMQKRLASRGVRALEVSKVLTPCQIVMTAFQKAIQIAAVAPEQTVHSEEPGADIAGLNRHWIDSCNLAMST